jgi:trehalose 6-phosphate synthase/phosphatase
MNNRLVVISSRLPLTIKRANDQWHADRSSGGLATAMGPLLDRSEGMWIGWSGEAGGRSTDVADPERQRVVAEITERYGYHPVDLPAGVARGFYEGFSNGTLWPLCHQFPMSVTFNPKDWDAYVEANRRFAEVAVRHIRPGDLVWVHDYQLMLVPKLIREAIPDARVGYFHHIPFPSSSIYRILPRREELLEGLLGADVVAFHTYPYLQHFRASLLRILGIESQMDHVEYDSRCVSLEALPIGIAPKEFTDLLDEDDATARRLAEIRLRFAGRRLLLGVDRLDYTKGIPQRLRTFRKLLEMEPELRGRAVLVQVAVPSRERVPLYKQLRREVDGLIGEINGEYATADWTPIVYIRRGIPRRELVALYAAAEAALVTPLRDGLNLVAKEYVACKRGGDGALVLSEFAGAAAEMGEAFIVNPYDEERTAETIARVLAMPAEQRKERMQALYKRVTRNDVFAWSERFLEALRGDGRAHAGRLPGTPDPLPAASIEREYGRAASRLLLLDYDGTLVGYAKRPQDALPTGELADVLSRLASDPANVVALVSGRARADLDRWFGEIPGLWLFAEHGAIMREPGAGAWRLPDAGVSADWKGRVASFLEHYVDRVPGSFVEEKEFSLVFHYRMADPMFAEWLANELVANLDQMLADTELRAVRGQKSVEVRLMRANKGEVLALLTDACPHPDFLLAAGDDRTDEDLFARLADTAWTIHVGTNSSRARFRLAGPPAMVALLRRLGETTKAEGKAN